MAGINETTGTEPFLQASSMGRSFHTSIRAMYCRMVSQIATRSRATAPTVPCLWYIYATETLAGVGAISAILLPPPCSALAPSLFLQELPVVGCCKGGR